MDNSMVKLYKAKKLGINAIGTRHSGAATVLLQLLDDLLNASSPEYIIVFATPASERRFSFPKNKRLLVVDAPSIAIQISSVRLTRVCHSDEGGISHGARPDSSFVGMTRGQNFSGQLYN